MTSQWLLGDQLERAGRARVYTFEYFLFFLMDFDNSLFHMFA